MGAILFFSYEFWCNSDVDGLACVQFHSIADLSKVRVTLHRENTAGTDDITSNVHRGLGYGISFFLSFGIGGIAPAICGWIAETYTLEMVFPMMALSLLPGLVACLFLIKQDNVQIP